MLQAASFSFRSLFSIHLEPRIKFTNTSRITVDENGFKHVNDYVVTNTIGSGSFAKVKLCYHNTSGTYYAMKITDKIRLRRRITQSARASLGGQNSGVDPMLLNELNVMSKLDHPNVVKLYEVINDELSGKLYLILEYVACGAILKGEVVRKHSLMSHSQSPSQTSLCTQRQGEPQRQGEKQRERQGEPQRLTRDESSDDTGTGAASRTNETMLAYDYSSFQAVHTHFDLDVIRYYFKQIIHGLHYIHSQHVVHGDIQPGNILVTPECDVKISDFGVSIAGDGGNPDWDMVSHAAGAPAFLPPETSEGGAMSGRCIDVWATGVTLYVLLYGRCPFNGTNISEIAVAVTDAHAEYPEYGACESVVVTSSVRDLLQRMLEKDPKKRITVPEIKTHTWVKADCVRPNRILR
eukprot:TRINITY_DN2126_c0_g1::TRINITY_DN2126_c0_g1_i1::g.12734::m.12734 TRINITY_DN2126_c0_g1::TRINITY_DN2126_c0_g1_i1::g.12734  ORF type:complete len:408 (+),score=42.20,sp/Q8N5S9/KKCC1_HUMAN/39.33/1e-34,sp/Q8N5S9/KKCC1_HUMAN/31.62/1e-09,Pkinase/PF00069.20/1.9e-14,Pkinase/PF00069.20/1.2e-35,Pkinase_Tyr/PF07714.12/5.6e-29,Kinase-like/PF14531.1/7.2e-08,RIO1/PF01163.17/0.12,APH/PF01636.18/0.21 TRINITY_DN2126_c0_g1_i1:305-1528(+)